MTSPVNIYINNIDTNKIGYVTSCMKHRTKDISCQKYPTNKNNYKMLLFRDVEFYGLYYLQI